MQTFLIGHRGTGKTSLLQRLQIYGQGQLPVFDLDREIEKTTGKKIAEIFEDRGEEFFRELEKKVLTKLIETHPKMVCALGAGFSLGSYVFPAMCEIVWVRRASDSWGRVFTDRPRLNTELSAREEYLERFQQREVLYSRNFDWIYLLPEGLTAPCEFEKAIWGNKLEDIGGVLTLRPDHFRNPQIFRRRLRHAGVDFFEMRTDFLNDAELDMSMDWIQDSQKLVAIRSWPLGDVWQEALGRAAMIDWALELGDVIPVQAHCVSSHERRPGETLFEWTERLRSYESRGLQVKWSPEIESFSDLEYGLNWQSENPDQRSFLPRSHTGRWAWARLLLKGRQRLNFFRDGDGSALDQPTMHEWIRSLYRGEEFAAVLGSPVRHSYSPIEHLAYARHRQLSFFSVDVREDEWDEAWPVLNRCGLKFAAVTAPLKRKACDVSSVLSQEASRLKSVNTLSKTQDGWRGHNTDLEGLRQVLQIFEMTPATTAVWGGGGTLPVLRELLPGASFYSRRTGELREGSNEPSSVETLVWAVGAQEPGPLQNWRPRLLLDLNYREDSNARAEALERGSNYVSGLMMFKEQAAAQRQEWDQYVE